MSIRERLDRNDVMVCEPHSELWRVGRVTGPIHFSRLDSEIAEDGRGGNRFDVLGIANLDISAVRSEHRLLTRLIATWVYRAADPETNYAMYSGIRYVSKIGNHECWAIFDGSELSLLGAGPIDGNDHAYRQAGAELGLRLH